MRHSPAPGAALLSVTNLRVDFGQREVVQGIDLRVAAGECLALVGESGSGKSVTARSVLGLAGSGSRVRADTMELSGRSVLDLSARQWATVRGRDAGLISQDALVSLDPLRPIGREVGDALRLHTRLTPTQRRARVLEALGEAGLDNPEVRFRQRQGELSGGQRQRALIASAIALRPPLLIADEPTTALDVTVQAQVLDLLRGFKERGIGILLISHDLAVVAEIADRVAVLSNGVIVEQGATAELLSSPTSAETRKLIAAVPFGRPRGVPLSHAARMARPAGEEVPRSSPRQDPPALRAVGLEKRFRLPGGKSVTAVADVSFVLEPGRTLGLVGESGSGKSTTARLALALTPPDAGEVTLGTGAWSRLRESERRPLRALVGSVYQDALSSFDPRLTTSDILTDALWKPGRSRHGNRTREVHHLLSTVGLSPDVLTRRPLHLSGGQRQRVAIARALASEPQILILDEPVSALDVSVQATVLDLLDELQRELGLSYLFISHDLGVVQHMSDTVAVMHSGRIVETGPTPDVFGRPSHPYTRRLLAASPRLPW